MRRHLHLFATVLLTVFLLVGCSASKKPKEPQPQPLGVPAANFTNQFERMGYIFRETSEYGKPALEGKKMTNKGTVDELMPTIVLIGPKNGLDEAIIMRQTSIRDSVLDVVLANVLTLPVFIGQIEPDWSKDGAAWVTKNIPKEGEDEVSIVHGIFQYTVFSRYPSEETVITGLACKGQAPVGGYDGIVAGRDRSEESPAGCLPAAANCHSPVDP